MLFSGPTYPFPANYCNSAPTVDSLGNVTVPASSIPWSRFSPPPSPPWGWGRNVQRNLTFNVSYKLTPLRMVPGTVGCFPSESHVGNVVLCTLTPVLGEQRDLAKHQKLKLHRVKAIRSRKKRAVVKSLLFADLKQRKLKRLQRRPILKMKKQEVYEKWEKRKIRREFKRRRQHTTSSRMSITDCDGNKSSGSEFKGTTFREGSESPFQCPLWCCKTTRRSRREEYEQNKRARLRSEQPSRLSCRSDKSRSPIIIRSSPRSSRSN